HLHSFPTRRSSDLISYSHSQQRRISSNQLLPRHLTQAPAGPVAIDRALDGSAHGDADPVLGSLAENGKSDQRVSGMKPFAAHRLVKVRAPAKPGGALDLRGQPLTALAPAVAQDARSAAGTHPAQKAVDAPAIPFLGLVGPFDRASIPEP